MKDEEGRRRITLIAFLLYGDHLFARKSNLVPNTRWEFNRPQTRHSRYLMKCETPINSPKNIRKNDPFDSYLILNMIRSVTHFIKYTEYPHQAFKRAIHVGIERYATLYLTLDYQFFWAMRSYTRAMCHFRDVVGY